MMEHPYFELTTDEHAELAKLQAECTAPPMYACVSPDEAARFLPRGLLEQLAEGGGGLVLVDTTDLPHGSAAAEIVAFASKVSAFGDVLVSAASRMLGLAPDDESRLGQQVWWTHNRIVGWKRNVDSLCTSLRCLAATAVVSNRPHEIIDQAKLQLGNLKLALVTGQADALEVAMIHWFWLGERAGCVQFLRETLGIWEPTMDHLERLWEYAFPMFGRPFQRLDRARDFEQFCHLLTKVVAEDVARRKRQAEAREREEQAWLVDSVEVEAAVDPDPTPVERLLERESEGLGVPDLDPAGDDRIVAVLTAYEAATQEQRALLDLVASGLSPAEAIRCVGATWSTWQSIQRRVLRRA